MPRWITIATVQDLPQPGRLLREFEGERIALFRLEDQWIAIDNHCPHRRGPLGAGPLQGDELTCPWHGWKFHLRTAACLTHPQSHLRSWPVRLVDDEVQIDVAGDNSTNESQPDGIFRTLVRYGKLGMVGCVGAIRDPDARRGQSVVIRTDRGLELGQVVVATQEMTSRQHPLRPSSEWVRFADENDPLHQAEREPLAQATLERARHLAREKGLAVEIVDSESMLDGETIVLYYLGEHDARLGPLSVGLAQFHQIPCVQFQQWPSAGDLAEHAANCDPPNSSLNSPVKRMKGPDERLKYDLRRVWECPICHHRERTSGTVSSYLCMCQQAVDPRKQKWMKLVEDGPRRVTPTKSVVAPPSDPPPAIATESTPQPVAQSGSPPSSEPSAQSGPATIPPQSSNPPNDPNG